MTRPLQFTSILLAAVSMHALAGTAAMAQDGVTTVDVTSDLAHEDEIEEVVVTGSRERGSVPGNVTPEVQLRAADIRALGVSSVSDLLSELGPQLQSASGRPPVTLLEGHRIASFREIASIPAEAISRVDILSEEVGVRYGYSADQKVMNIVLRQRFRAFNGEVDGSVPTAGDGKSGGLEGGFFLIRNSQRLNISAEHKSAASIMETDRGLDRPESAARSLQPVNENLTVNASYSRPVGERTKATLSGELATDRRESKVGLPLSSVTIPGGTPFAVGSEDVAFYPQLPGMGALGRSSSSQTGEIGLTVNAERSAGQWTLTANYAREETRGITARPFNLVDYAAAIANGDALADPALPIAPMFLIGRPADQTATHRDTANVDFVYNRSLFVLPAGDVSATAKLSGSLLRLETSQERDLLTTRRNIARDSAGGSLNLDFPIFTSSAPLGRLSANANGGIEELSDAGTLRSFGVGLNWTPRRGISFAVSYSDEESAATPQQLGDPQTVTQFVPVFDYVRGESVLVTTLTGGNSLLSDASARNLRLGAVLTLLQDPDLRLNINYSRRETTGRIAQFPGITEDTALAFPDRFQRDGTGRLVSVDLRPINMGEQKRDALRWGLSFSKRLKTPQSQIDAMRAASLQRRGQAGSDGGSEGRGPMGAAPEGTQTAGGGGADQPRGVAGAPGGGRMRGGGGGGGRVDFSIHHEWTLTNTTQLAPTLPVLNLLDGDALGDGSGPSRHTVEMRGGISRSGLGLRLSGEWKNATRVNGTAGLPSSQLQFDDLATLDLRIFANLSQMPKLVQKMPFLRGVRVQLGVNNIFDARQRVTDGNGAVPFAYQPAFIDPVGRSVRVSIRKLFI